MRKVFGRDKLIARLWRLLADYSILFTAERRVGKTTVLNTLEKTGKQGFRVIYSDLEKIDSPLQLVNELLNTTTPFISHADKASGWFFDLRKALGGTEIGGVIKLPEQKEKEWKASLQATIKAICNNTEDIVVFLWDEIPYMLQKINAHETANGSNEKSSLQIMDTLRALRQEHTNLRMIFTGSIGLHHVLNTLTDDSYASESVNDMEKIELRPLDTNSARALAIFHLNKESINRSDALITSIIELCNYIPFYIEKLIRRLAIYEETITQALVKNEITRILTDARDDWEMEHFRSRLNIYYKGVVPDAIGGHIKRSVLAKSILNHCAVSSQPQSIDDCYRAVKSNYSLDNRDVIVDILKSLIKDHYLLRDEQGLYLFSFSLVQQWWILAEGLNSYSDNSHA